MKITGATIQKMDGQEFVDFFTFLPDELVENILCRLMDDDTWTSCRLVCKNWDAKISSNSHLWLVACEKLGLNVKKAQEAPEVDYKGIFLRMRKRFQQIKNGSHQFFDVEKLDFPEYHGAMHYHHGIIAIGNGATICICELEPNFRVVHQVDTVNSGASNCIHFDNSYLVAGTNAGHVVTYKMPTMEKLYTKMAGSLGMSCVTFNKDIDLLVTATGNIVAFCCLSSGKMHFALTIDCGIKKLKLYSSPGLQYGCDYMLLCIDGTSCHRLTFNSQQIAADRIYPSVLHTFYPCSSVDDNYITNAFVYFLSTIEGLWFLVECNPVSGKLQDIGLLQIFRRNDLDLVAVGRKYAVFLQVSHTTETLSFVIYDLATGSEFASFTIPPWVELDTLFTYADCLQNASWLHGFDGFNDKGVFLVVEVNYGTFYAFKWSKLNDL